LRELNDIERYAAWQKRLESMGNGVRLNPDIRTYDKQRIKLFFESKID
jgi:hypothetical protein